MIRAIAIDNDPQSLSAIEKFCRESKIISLNRSFTDPRASLKYLNKYPADLLFIDMDLPLINGIDLYKQVQQDSMVVFVSSSGACAAESFTLMAVDYLLKPFTTERFQQTIKRTVNYFKFKTQFAKATNSNYLYLRADLNLVKVDISKIEYIQALDDYLKIYTDDQKALVVRMTMKAILNKLPANKFIRTHRSFIVAVDRIRGTRHKTVVVNELEIPVSAVFAKDVDVAFRR